MDDVYGISIQKLLLRVRLDENRAFNKSVDQVLEDKDKLQRLPESSSSLYRKPRLPPGRIRAQAVNFRLAPLLTVQEGENACSISDANAWTVTERRDSMLPCFPERSSSRQTWLRRMSKWETQFVPDSTFTSPTPLSSMYSDYDSCPTSDSCTPLPVFKKRMPTETFLIRRPTIEKPIAITADDEMFDVFVKSFELKALPFKKTAESYAFYKTHFPLLLTKITKDTERCSTPSRRSRTPESPMSVMINRKRAMNQRMVELEFMMEVMEKETEDCKFVTELHSPVFDPTTWPWNIVDVNGLRRRYTIDASLRET